MQNNHKKQVTESGEKNCVKGTGGREGGVLQSPQRQLENHGSRREESKPGGKK